MDQVLGAHSELGMLTAWCSEPQRNFLVDLVQNNEPEEELAYEVLSRSVLEQVLLIF
jgi:hypothetical protein